MLRAAEPADAGTERIRIGRIDQDHADQLLFPRPQHFTDRTVAGAIVEDAAAAADHRLLVERIGDAQPRRDIVVVGEDVLPVIPEPGGDRQPVVDVDLILDERAENLLEEHEPAVAPLLEERQRPPERVVVERGEGVGAVAVGAIVEAAPAEVGHLEAALEEMLAVDVGGRLGEIEVILGRALIGLRSAGRERVEHHDVKAGMQADGRPGLVPDQQPEFVEQPPGQHAARAHDDLRLVTRGRPRPTPGAWCHRRPGCRLTWPRW